MHGQTAAIREREDCRPDALPLAELLAGNEPVVLRGLVRNWPLVQAGRNGAREAMRDLLAHYNGKPVQYSHGGPEVAGRPFYNQDFTALNTELRRGRLDALLEEILAHAGDAHPPTWYLASTPVDVILPGLRAGNDLDFASQGVRAPPAIWIGNRTIASCHYDAPSNIACVVVGRRRFTLFPPEQVRNLYLGPLELTPGGQAVSTVDIDNPDFN